MSIVLCVCVCAFVHRGHFKSVISKPQNVFVMRDISCGGYVAGGNCDFFAKKTDGSFTTDEARDNIMKRLSFTDEGSAKYASMLAFPMPLDSVEKGEMDTVMSVTSRLLPWEVGPNNQGVNHNSFPGGQNAYEVYNAALLLNQIHYGEDMRSAENMEFISQGSTNNALCFVGPHRCLMPATCCSLPSPNCVCV